MVGFRDPDRPLCGPFVEARGEMVPRQLVKPVDCFENQLAEQHVIAQNNPQGSSETRRQDEQSPQKGMYHASQGAQGFSWQPLGLFCAVQGVFRNI